MRICGDMAVFQEEKVNTEISSPKADGSRSRVKRIHVLLALLVLSVCAFPFRDSLLTLGQPSSGITVPMPAGVTAADGDVGLAIVAAARSQVGKTVTYDPRYVRLNYPLGDVPIETGVCTDVIVRALRGALGMDLQRLVHEDMRGAFLLYPKWWKLKFPDKSIEHRRVLNLMRYFERKGFSLPISGNPEDYLPGDIISTDVHIMIVSDRKTEQGVPLIIHNIGRGVREETGLFTPAITGHYRMTHRDKQHTRANAIFPASLTAVIGAIVAWRYFRKRRKRK
ncbi:MAG: DUF1287 domain-containing protein [Kiritimatiellaeota bacterium]|nr:DUF1287 domain-containing protein [Kiritimatiellota bacterium]